MIRTKIVANYILGYPFTTQPNGPDEFCKNSKAILK